MCTTPVLAGFLNAKSRGLKRHPPSAAPRVKVQRCSGLPAACTCKQGQLLVKEVHHVVKEALGPPCQTAPPLNTNKRRHGILVP